MQNLFRSTSLDSDRRLCSSEADLFITQRPQNQASGDQDGEAPSDGSRQSRLVGASPLLVALPTPSRLVVVRPSAGPPEALETLTGNLSPAASKTALKRARFDWLRRHSSVRRQRACMTQTVAGSALVLDRGGRWRASGLRRCGRVDCPECGSVLASARGAEVELAADRWIRYEGGTLAMLTFTFGHRRGDKLADLNEYRKMGWDTAATGKAWVEDRRDFGVGGYVRVLEVTCGCEFGWHAHIHLLVFLERSAGSVAAQKAIDGLAARMYSRFRKGIVKAGGRAPSRRGQEAHEVTGEQAGQMIGDYLTKQVAAPSSKLAKAMAWEMTGAVGKTAGRSALDTPGAHLSVVDLLDAGRAGDEDSARLYAEYEAACVGLRTYQWSLGLRDRVGLNEAEDVTAMLADADEKSAQDVLVLSFRERGWKKLRCIRNGLSEMLALGEQSGAQAVIAWLAERGIEARPGRWEDEEGETQ